MKPKLLYSHTINAMKNIIQICRFGDLPLMLWRFRAIALTILLFSNQILAAGILDPAFGNGGKVNFRFEPNSDDVMTSAALQPDGKIVLAGRTSYVRNGSVFTDLSVSRLNTDGSPDNTFGTGGWVITSFGFALASSGASKVIILPDGKILVGGGTNGLMALARYNPNGTLDPTFDGDGKVTTDFDGGTGEDAAYLLPQADGKVIAAGQMNGSTGNPPQTIVLARYNPDGSLDATFGDGGKFRLLFPGFITYLFGAAIQPDGKILISGRYVYNRPGCTPSPNVYCGVNQNFLKRYDQQMRPDRKFGFRGDIRSEEYFGELSVQPDGYILVSGFPVAKRFSSGGWLETKFAPTPFTPQGPAPNEGTYQLAKRPNGTTVGCHRPASFETLIDFTVVLFGSDGRYIAADQRDFYAAHDICRSLLIQPDGKILAAGTAQVERDGKSSFAVIRYLDIVP
jgi:uncharacterized delta-60 repeat protein